MLTKYFLFRYGEKNNKILFFFFIGLTLWHLLIHILSLFMRQQCNCNTLLIIDKYFFYSQQVLQCYFKNCVHLFRILLTKYKFFTKEILFFNKFSLIIQFIIVKNVKTTINQGKEKKIDISLSQKIEQKRRHNGQSHIPYFLI